MNNAILTHIYVYSGKRGYSAEYQAVLDRAVLEGFDVPTSTTSSAINRFINRRVADGSWERLDRLWIPALNDTNISDFSRISLKNPSTSNLASISNVLYTVNGWKGDPDNSGYVDTGFNPSTQGDQYALNSASRGFYVIDAATVSPGYYDGIESTAENRTTSHAAGGTQQRLNQGFTNLDSTVDMSGVGYRALNRSDSENVDVYVGTVKNTRGAASSSIPNANHHIFRSFTTFSDPTIGMYFMGGSLSEEQHNNIANDFEEFLTEIGL